MDHAILHGKPFGIPLIPAETKTKFNNCFISHCISTNNTLSHKRTFGSQKKQWKRFNITIEQHKNTTKLIYLLKFRLKCRKRLFFAKKYSQKRRSFTLFSLVFILVFKTAACNKITCSWLSLHITQLSASGHIQWHIQMMIEQMCTFTCIF
jgi:hypothetical protein